MNLIPKKEPQKLNLEIWDQYTPYENKMELIAGKAFGGDEQREKMLLALVYNMGLAKFTEILPEESRKLLKELL